MWSCSYCISKNQQADYCIKKECENSLFRFNKIELLWDHFKVKHPKIYQKLTNNF